MAERRRLPVLQQSSTPAPDDEEPRSPWHWVGFGTVAIFAGWLPLAYVGGFLSQRAMNARFGANASREDIARAVASMTAGEHARLMATVALPNMVALAIASFVGGAIVGRFSGAGRVTVRISALSGAMTAVLATASAWKDLTAATAVATAVTFVLAMGFAGWGGRFGRARAPRT